MRDKLAGVFLKILFLLLFLITAALIALFVWTKVEIAKIEEMYPASGTFSGPVGKRIHFVDLTADANVSLPRFCLCMVRAVT